MQTCLQVPQLGLLFDVGVSLRSFAGTGRVFITHGHADHCGALISMLSIRMLMGRTEPLQVYAPAPICDALRTAVDAFSSIQGHPYRYEVHPVEPGSEIDIGHKRVVRVYRSVHVIYALGYSVFETVHKLRPRFYGLPGEEIGRRKRAGEDLFDIVERSIVSFPGDTTIKTLAQNPHLYSSRVLILEATYLDARRSVEQCHNHGHVHLDEILAQADRFENEHLVLTHFSQSYKPAEVTRIVAARTANAGFRPTVQALVPASGDWPG